MTEIPSEIRKEWGLPPTQPAPGRWYWTQETVVGERREHLLRRLFKRSAEGDEYYAVTDGAEGHIEELAVYLNAIETERDALREEVAALQERLAHYLQTPQKPQP